MNLLGYVLPFLVLNVVVVISAQSSSDTTIHKLRKHIFNGYDVHARPVKNPSDTTVVEAGLMPIHITEFNENKGILTMEAWITMKWHDVHMKWEPNNFGAIKALRVSEKEVWKPDLTIWDGRGSQLSPWTTVQVIVFNTGIVMWVPSATLQVICGIVDYSRYPNDVQHCNVTIGSWTNDAYSVNLKLYNDTVSLKDYRKSYNPHWQLVAASARRTELFYDCCGDTPYSNLVFLLTMKRQHVPFSSLSSTPETVARVLILCMFWVTRAIKKFLFGCTSLLILTTVAACITSNLPSPAAASAALSQVNSALTVCMAAIVMEVLVTAIASLRMGHPAFLDTLASSTAGMFLAPCGSKATDDKDPENPDQKISQWPLLATIIDRVAFVMFAVFLISV